MRTHAPVHSRTPFALAVILSLAAFPTLRAQQPADDDARSLSDCQHNNWDRSDRAHFCEIRVEHVTRPETLTVDGGENGGVSIIGWDGDSVVMHALITTTASSPDDAKSLASRVTIAVANGRIHADGPESGHHEHWWVSYRVYVPRHIGLSMETHNGPMSVERVSGRMDIKTVNGPLSLSDVGGDVHARAENGPIDVELNGARWDGTGLDAESENGPVELTLPAHYAAHLTTGTENGPMDVHFPLTLQGNLNTRHLSMDINGGGPPIRVVTTNGPVTLRHDSD